MLILSLDPGESTGYMLGETTDTTPLTLSGQGVVDGGCDGFIPWIKSSCFLDIVDVVVCERFIIDGTHTGVWSPQIEGALKALSPTRPIWQLRSDKAKLFGQKFKGDKGQTERFNWLRDHGFTGEGHELDAITHALVYLKLQGHKPTLRKFWNAPEEGGQE